MDQQYQMSSQRSLTYAVVHLIAVLLQVVLDAALKEIQFGFELLREAKHAVFTPRQVGVVAQEAQPARVHHRCLVSHSRGS